MLIQETIRQTVFQAGKHDNDSAKELDKPVVYLMRGLPACGKSHTARQLAGDVGVILETDEYFISEVGDPDDYSWDDELLDDAREWNFGRFQDAIAQSRTPIVVDRGNGLNLDTKEYAQYAVDNGYRVELREPDSPWWNEIRVLLKYRPATNELLDEWAAELERISQDIHRVGYKTIRRWMQHWADDLHIDEILNYRIRDNDQDY
jgi:hypothetical protein